MNNKPCDRCGIKGCGFVEELMGFFCGACQHDIFEAQVGMDDPRDVDYLYSTEDMHHEGSIYDCE